MEIVGYTYKADQFCTSCIIDALATGPGQDFDGWALAAGAAPESAEQQLDEIAAAFGIDRADETTYDSDYFPKVITSYQIDALLLQCGACYSGLDEDDEEPEEDDDELCRSHGAEDCSDPDCIRARGGSVLAAELRQAERLIGSD